MSIFQCILGISGSGKCHNEHLIAAQCILEAGITSLFKKIFEIINNNKEAVGLLRISYKHIFRHHTKEPNLKK